MPGWPEKRTLIGSRTIRVDGPPKVTGAAKYSSDVQPEGWLYGMILRSKWPKARITQITLDKALKIRGIKAAVLDAKTAFTGAPDGEDQSKRVRYEKEQEETRGMTEDRELGSAVLRCEGT